MTLNIKQKIVYAVAAAVFATTMLLGNSSTGILTGSVDPYNCGQNICDYP